LKFSFLSEMTKKPHSSGSSIHCRQLVKDVQSGPISPVETFCSQCGWACEAESCPRCKSYCNTVDSKLPKVSKLWVPTIRLTIDIAPMVSQVDETIPQLEIGQGKALDIPSSSANSPATSPIKKIVLEPSGPVEHAIDPDNFPIKINDTKQTNADSPKSETANGATLNAQRNWSDTKHPNSGELVYAYSDSSSDEIAPSKRFLSSSGSSGPAEKPSSQQASAKISPLKTKSKPQASCKIEETDTEEEF